MEPNVVWYESSFTMKLSPEGEYHKFTFGESRTVPKNKSSDKVFTEIQERVDTRCHEEWKRVLSYRGEG